jgi:hypothetical protein
MNGRLVVSTSGSSLLIARQLPLFKGEPGETQDLGGRTEIIPVKDSHTRIGPLALASGHGRYITVTPEQTLVSVGEWPLHITVIETCVTAVSLLKTPCSSFKSETATWIQKWLKKSVGTSKRL